MRWDSGWDDNWSGSGGWGAGRQEPEHDGERAIAAIALTAADLSTLQAAAAVLDGLARPRRAVCAHCGAAIRAELDAGQASKVAEVRAGLRALCGKAANPSGATLWFGER